MSKLADAYVEISAKLDKLQSGLDAAHSMTQSGVNRTSGMMLGLWSAVTQQAIQMFQRMAQGIAQGIQEAVLKAGDLNESVSKVGATFGASAGVIIEAADAMAAKFGTNKQVFVDGAANIGLIGKGAGMAKDEAAKFGVQFAKLADDIASFDNVSFDEAMVALRAGLVGETEPLRRFGVAVMEADVKREAFRLGLANTAKEITNQDKVTARASLIMQGFTDRIGDHERTQSSMNNVIREAQGRWENFRAELGQKLIPVVSQMSAGFGGLVKSLQDDFHTTDSELNKMGEVWKTVFTDIGSILDKSGETTETWKDRIIAALKQVGEAASDLTGIVRLAQIGAEGLAGLGPGRGSPLGAGIGEALRTLQKAASGGDIDKLTDVLHVFADVGREADRRDALNAALAAQRDKQAEKDQAKRPFVGPPMPTGVDLARMLDAADQAKAEEARRAANAAITDRDRRVWGGIFKGIPGLQAGIADVAGTARAKLPFQLNGMLAGGAVPDNVRNLMGAAGMGGLADLAGGALRAGAGLEKGIKMREAFQSSMMNTSDIASEVTKAALSKKDGTEKNTEETAKATKEAAGYLKTLVDSQGRVTYARFAPRGAK